MDANEVALFTIESLPVSLHIGAIGAWAVDPDLSVAEGQALDGLRDAAAACGGDTVVGLRGATEREITITWQNPLFTNDVDISTEWTYRVYASGTAARR